jgi:hypothetical protein
VLDGALYSFAQEIPKEAIILHDYVFVIYVSGFEESKIEKLFHQIFAG